ncbi:hypothetical protein [Myxococcus sp. Y35]|uniref:hypothetical protein n=1 Tax=Pseudomyxococcus flavus TaxID=3115648 RepID=UPI003CFB6403
MHFAVEPPSHFRVMYSQTWDDAEKYPEVHAAGSSSYRRLLQWAEAAHVAMGGTEDRETLALTAWASGSTGWRRSGTRAPSARRREAAPSSRCWSAPPPSSAGCWPMPSSPSAAHADTARAALTPRCRAGCARTARASCPAAAPRAGAARAGAPA